MRVVLPWAACVATVGLLGTMPSSAMPATIAAPAAAPSIVGTWKGPFLGSAFTFEFKQDGKSWTGRYQSEKSKKWASLRNIIVAGDTVSFDFESQPPSTFTLKIDTAGKTLNGSATFGKHAALPLTLTRAA